MPAFFKCRNFNCNVEFNFGLTLITFLVFILEIAANPLVASSIGYVFVVLLCYFDRGFKKVYFFSLLSIMLITVDYFVVHTNDINRAVIFTNRLISVTGIILAAFVTIKFKRVTQKHRNSESLLHSVLSSANESVMILDEQGKIIYHNDSAKKMFGYEDFKLLGMQLSEIVHDEFNNKQTDFSESLKKNANCGAVGAKVMHSNGTEIPVDISVSNFKTNDGTFFTCFIMDTSERRKAEEEIKRKNTELEKSENFLHSIIQNLPLHIIVRDAQNHKIVLENKEVTEIAGYCEFDPAKNIDDCSGDCITENEARLINEADEDVIISGNAVIIPEFHVYSHAGRETIMRVIKAPIINGAGKVLYIIDIREDITSRIYAKRELNKQNELLLETQEIGNVGSFETDLSCRTVSLSKEMMHIVGVESQESYPFIQLMDYIHWEDRQRIDNALKNTIDENKLCDEKYRIIRPDKKLRYVWLKAKTIYNELGKPVFLRGVISDITELKIAEENLKEYINGLKQMMYMTSHKVRVPIANIIGMVNILEQSLNSPEKLNRLLNYIKKSAFTLDVFTKELTAYMETIKKEKNQFMRNYVSI